MTYVYALLGTLAVSLVSLAGLFSLSAREESIKKYIYIFVSLAVGALLGDVFIHLLPESFEALENSTLVGLLVIAGFFIFFILEKFLHWHHHSDDANENHAHPVGKLILFLDGVHNFIDGVVIGVSFMVSVPVGIATTIAVILHEIPQEIGDFAVLLHAGYTRARALWLNFLSALLAVLGTVVAFVLGESSDGVIMYILPIAAGGFIYIAAADLIPELHKTKSLRQSAFQFIVLICGVLLMLLLTLREHAH
ncbi:MAG: ZIP family metal transporter [Candidatus Paceibacterota bacterium]